MLDDPTAADTRTVNRFPIDEHLIPPPSDVPVPGDTGSGFSIGDRVAFTGEAGRRCIAVIIEFRRDTVCVRRVGAKAITRLSYKLLRKCED
jgi:hypothetical protein